MYRQLVAAANGLTLVTTWTGSRLNLTKTDTVVRIGCV